MSELQTEMAEGWARLRLVRPERRNALNTALLQKLAAEMGRLDADPAVRAIVISGEGGNFAAGADIDEIAEKSSADGRSDPRKAAWAAIRATRTPVIAAVEGYCLGGGFELALMADMMVVAPEARLGLPESSLGIVPGAGGAERLTALAGRARAMRLVLTGEMIPGTTAHDWGVAAWLSETPQDEAEAIAIRIAARAPLALATAKAMVVAASEGPLAGALDTGRAGFEALLDTADKAEGIAAFRARRKPDFIGQ